jgi:hypothetical protein
MTIWDKSTMDVATVNPPCPGTKADSIRLTNEFTTAQGIGHPTNTGECKLFLHGLDAQGELTDNSLTLLPGESANWFRASSGSVAIVVACANDCSGRGELTYDLPVS